MYNPKDPGVAGNDDDAGHDEGCDEERRLGGAARRVWPDGARTQVMVVAKRACQHVSGNIDIQLSKGQGMAHWRMVKSAARWKDLRF